MGLVEEVLDAHGGFERHAASAQISALMARVVSPSARTSQGGRCATLPLPTLVWIEIDEISAC